MKKEIPEPPPSQPFVLELRALAGRLAEWLQERRSPEGREAWRGSGCDVVEDEAHYELELDLPGVAPECLSIAVDGHELVVTAVAAGPRSPFSFRHVVHLPAGIDDALIEARHRKGGLTLLLPKRHAGQARRIEVEP